MSNAKLVNIARLMTTYNFEIKQLPDNLKCAQCKLVLSDACKLPCCCIYCRVCIDDMMARGGKFCPGSLEKCAESALSRVASDYASNKGVSRLTVKCSREGCVHECPLANIEEHFRVCHRTNEFGCTQDKFVAEEMGGYLQCDNCSHSEILKLKYETISKEIETLKHELVLKDGQIRSIMDHITHMQNENKSIKEKNEDLVSRMKILTETIEREIAERREKDELNRTREIDHVGRVMTAMTRVIASNKNELVTEMQSVRGYIGSINEGVESINEGVESIKDEICSVKSQSKSVQELMGLEKFDASCVWLININVGSKTWEWGQNVSEFFTGAVYPYKYRLTSSNNHIGTTRSALRIQLRIYANPNDGELAWPFEARVVITVADRDKREACKSNSLQCRIEKPPDNSCSWSDYLVFPHSQLREAGLNLSRGVRVSCMIVLRCSSMTS